MKYHNIVYHFTLSTIVTANFSYSRALKLPLQTTLCVCSVVCIPVMPVSEVSKYQISSIYYFRLKKSIGIGIKQCEGGRHLGRRDRRQEGGGVRKERMKIVPNIPFAYLCHKIAHTRRGGPCAKLKVALQRDRQVFFASEYSLKYKYVHLF